ncbi:hypothetical protein CEP52_017514 [Fusarium oligoseptatum]|uniref:Uncharacterized protein n=1 Tax=Fusarium oligoseptatum TaxID=2604345 RepID=A0A428RPS9_9HYPO|nr:hypothetical protein CEP52_017514 [Fusarium oligoseptatum]
MPNTPEVSEIVAATSARVAAIRESVRQWEDSLQNIRTPQQVYQEKRQALRDAFNQELQLLMSGEAGDDGASRENRTESLIQYGGQLKELEQQYGATIRADEKVYQQRVEKQTVRLVAALRDLGDVSLTASDQEEPAQPVDKQAVVAAPSDPPPETRTDSHVPHHEDHHMEEVPEVRRTSDDDPQTDPDPQPVRPSRSDSMVAHVDQPDPQPVNHTQPDSQAANVSQSDRQPASQPVTHPRTATKPKKSISFRFKAIKPASSKFPASEAAAVWL